MPSYYSADADALYHRGTKLHPQTPSARAGERAEATLRLFRRYRDQGMETAEAKLRAEIETPDVGAAP